jgi:hypothetical protein
MQFVQGGLLCCRRSAIYELLRTAAPADRHLQHERGITYDRQREPPDDLET